MEISVLSYVCYYFYLVYTFYQCDLLFFLLNINSFKTPHSAGSKDCLIFWVSTEINFYFVQVIGDRKIFVFILKNETSQLSNNNAAESGKYFSIYSALLYICINSREVHMNFILNYDLACF